MTTNYFDEAETRWSEEFKNTSKDISKFILEQAKLDADFVKRSRLEYLRFWLTVCEEKEKPLIKAFDRFMESIAPENEWFIETLREIHAPLLRKKKKILSEIEMYENPVYQDDKITETMIENARNYPIEDIIEINKDGFTLCPFHNDKNPSAFCKNNYLYCFSCNEQADSIKLYQHINHCNFKEAIKSLNNIK